VISFERQLVVSRQAVQLGQEVCDRSLMLERAAVHENDAWLAYKHDSRLVIVPNDQLLLVVGGGCGCGGIQGRRDGGVAGMQRRDGTRHSHAMCQELRLELELELDPWLRSVLSIMNSNRESRRIAIDRRIQEELAHHADLGSRTRESSERDTPMALDQPGDFLFIGELHMEYL